MLCFRLSEAHVLPVAIFARCHQNASAENPLSPCSQLPHVSIEPRDQTQETKHKNTLSLSLFSAPRALPLLQYVFLACDMNTSPDRSSFNHHFNGSRCLLCDKLGRRGLFGSSSAWLLKWSNVPGFAPSLCDFRGILRLMGRIKLCRGRDRSLHFKCGSLSGTGKLLQAMFVIGWIREIHTNAQGWFLIEGEKNSEVNRWVGDSCGTVVIRSMCECVCR